MPFEKRLERHLQREERRLRARVRQRRDQRVDAPLAAGEPRPRRQLRPVQLQHLTRPVARPLRRTHARRPQLAQPPLDQIDRAVVAVLVAQQLGRSRRLDLRPVLKHAAQHRLERVELRRRRRPPVARRLLAPRQPGDRPPVDPQPPRDLPRRDPVRYQRPHLSPLQPAAHLPPPRLDPTRPVEPASRVGQIRAAASGALFAARSRCSISRPASSRIGVVDSVVSATATTAKQ
jgi:hypothetical protein